MKHELNASHHRRDGVVDQNVIRQLHAQRAHVRRHFLREGAVRDQPRRLVIVHLNVRLLRIKRTG